VTDSNGFKIGIAIAVTLIVMVPLSIFLAKKINQKINENSVPYYLRNKRYTG
jgi:hypothetical protein